MPSLSILEHKLKRFDINTKPIMENYLKELNVDISDYTFAANFIWLSNASGFWTIINETFCLFILNGGELSMLLPPLGKKDRIYDAMIDCFAVMNENNTSRHYSKIEYVHESMLEGFVDYLEEGTLIFEMLQDYLVEKKLVDYIYKTDELIELKGNSYHTKRNEINKFRKAYPSYRTEILVCAEHENAVVDLFNKWVSDRVKYMPKEEADAFLDGIYLERLAIKRALRHYEEMQLMGLVIFIDDVLMGFTVGERVNDNTASVIIEKTDFEVLGCAQYIFREFCKVLKNEYNCEYINVGDDMGFENLKKVKMSYRPEKLIPKYTIYQK